MQKRQIYRNGKQASGFPGLGCWKGSSLQMRPGEVLEVAESSRSRAVVTVAQLCNLLNIIELSVLITGDF